MSKEKYLKKYLKVIVRVRRDKILMQPIENTDANFFI